MAIRSTWKSIAAASVIAGLLLTGCTTGTTGAASDGDSGGAADPTHVYAKGIPTLETLYASSESAPPSSGPALAPGKNIYFVSCGQLATGCSAPAFAVQKVAKQIGWKVTIVDGAFNVGDGYAKGIRQAIAAKADGIAVHGIGCSEIQQPLKEAKAAGIPVFNSEGVDCDDPKNPGGAGESLYVNLRFNEKFDSAGEFFYQAGFNQAAYLINATKGKAQIIRDEYTGNPQGAYQREGQDAALAKCSGCKVLSTVKWIASDSGASGPLNQKFQTSLIKYPSANAVMASYDSVAVSNGWSKAIVDARRQKSMIVVAGEGSEPALGLLASDAGINAVFGQAVSWIGWALVDTMNRHFNDSPQVVQGFGFRLIDKNHNMMPAGKDYSPPIDLAASYLKSWGVK